MSEITDLDPVDGNNTSLSGEGTTGSQNMSKVDDLFQATLGLLARSIRTNVLRFLDNTDDTKRLALDLSGITTATTRTLTMGDADVTLRPRAWELISTASVTSATAAVDFTNLSAYRLLRLHYRLLPATNSVGIIFRASQDNGATFRSGAADYGQQAEVLSGATSSVSRGDNSYVDIAPGVVTNGSDGDTCGTAIIFDANQASYTSIEVQTGGYEAAGYKGAQIHGTIRFGVINAIRVLASSGNISKGYFVLEGVRG